jgi:hypothetical protein
MSHTVALLHPLKGAGVLYFFTSGNTYSIICDKVARRLLKRHHIPTMAAVDAAIAWGPSRDLSRIPAGWQVLEVDGIGLQSSEVH